MSGLSSLEHDADADDFDLRMLQTARDERRLKAALHSRVHVFGKARTHPRVGLTMANLERSNAHAHALHRPSPPSSISSNGGSTSGDPAMHAPLSWGSKSRAKRHWMRSIACEPETASVVNSKPEPATKIKPMNSTKSESEMNAQKPEITNHIQQAPAIHIKSKPEHDVSAEWDLTFELNEASMIASTPYIPRSTTLDDIRQRETDSQHLLRRLARVSHTPPTTRTTQPLQRHTKPVPPESNPEPDLKSELEAEPEPEQASPLPMPTLHRDTTPPRDTTPLQDDTQSRGTLLHRIPPHDTPPRDTPPQKTQPPDTPLAPKTPVVTGAWLDTPAPLNLPPTNIPPRSRSASLTKRSPHQHRTPSLASCTPAIVPPVSVLHPNLPTSALQALVCQAKSSDRRPSTDYGDSTLNSLQDLIADAPDVALDEDTLQGLQLPTAAPQNEAQRQRQQELLHLHRMNDRLRAARTSIRDASRGMKRVEDQVDHVEQDPQGNTVQPFRRGCPCATTHAHDISFWRWAKSLVWQKRLQTLRQASNSKWRAWGGLTGFGIVLTLFLVWWISEEIAWYVARPVISPMHPSRRLSL